ncbi:MAG: sulfotransferase domain-containing protein [Thermoleophilaceae bacterium]
MEEGLPDFVIAGAPKCGTTALYSRLADHPAVFMPAVKEPHFFSEDLPGIREVSTLKGYASLYAHAPPGTLRGDASASCLFSEVAVGRILERNRSARFVVILRDPVEAAYAFHSEQLFNLSEDVQDFAVAWSLQEARSRGEAIPSGCREPRLLQYRRLFAYGEQLDRLFSRVPEAQRFVLLLDDLRRDSLATFHRVAEFLGLGDDGKGGFALANPNKRLRSRRASLWHRRARSLSGPIYAPAKRAANALGLYPSHVLERWNVREAARPPLDPTLRGELREAFASEVAHTERLLGRPLAWGAEDEAPPQRTAAHSG